MKIGICLLLIAVFSYAGTTFSPGNTFSNCNPAIKCTCCKNFNKRSSFRTIDGTCNNLRRKTQGAANTILARLLPPDYADPKNLGTPHGFPGTKKSVPTAHQVSRAFVSLQEHNEQDKKGLSALFMAMGQFIDHDVGLSPHASCNVSAGCGSLDVFKYPCFPIKFAENESRCTPFARSFPVCQTGNKKRSREQINVLSSYLDLSQVYGADFKLHQSLRKLDGSGEMKVTKSNLLPIAALASDPACDNPVGCSLVGDSRGDENIVLSSMHTLFVRYHNVIAKALKINHKKWSEHKLFETARKINIGIYQRIVYNEFVPKLVSIDRYRGYRSRVDASIVSVFSTAAFRFGHSLVPNSWAMLDNNFDKAYNDISLRASFFNTFPIRHYGVEPIVYGLLQNQSQHVDTQFAFGLARKLFVPVGKPGYGDLPALNIQRGRDHGLKTYGSWRKLCKLRKLSVWSDLIGLMPSSIIQEFKKLYKHPNDIDLYAAAMSEKHGEGQMLGETFRCIIANQFERLRNGDRFYYERIGVFTWRQKVEIKKMTLAKVLCSTLKDVVSMQLNALQAYTPGTIRRICNSIVGANFQVW